MQFTSTGTTVFIENLELRCRVGKHAPERKTLQTVIVDVACEVSPAAISSDFMRASVDYVPIVSGIKALGDESKSRKLIETLAEEIAKICFQDPKVSKATITIRKPKKLPGVEAVGVTRTFTRS